MRTVAWPAAALAVVLAASPASAQLGADAQRNYDDFQRRAPHRAIAIGPDGKANFWAGAAGADRSRAVEPATKNCEERSKAGARSMP
jgi:hypothetical protein